MDCGDHSGRVQNKTADMMTMDFILKREKNDTLMRLTIASKESLLLLRHLAYQPLQNGINTIVINDMHNTPRPTNKATGRLDKRNERCHMKRAMYNNLITSVILSAQY